MENWKTSEKFAAVVITIICLAFWVAIIWVTWHFIAKWW